MMLILKILMVRDPAKDNYRRIIRFFAQCSQNQENLPSAGTRENSNSSIGVLGIFLRID